MTAPANTPVGVSVDSTVECLATFMDRHGYPPTMTQLGECLGLKSRSSVLYWLRRCEEEGKIERVMNGHYTKAIRIVE